MKKIAQIILAVAIVALVYVIYDQISTPIKFDDELKAKKAQVIDRIKDIRTAQRAFKSKSTRWRISSCRIRSNSSARSSTRMTP